jgi:hypothetical protein
MGAPRFFFLENSCLFKSMLRLISTKKGRTPAKLGQIPRFYWSNLNQVHIPKMASFMSTILTKIPKSYPFQEYDFGIFVIFTYLFQHPPPLLGGFLGSLCSSTIFQLMIMFWGSKRCTRSGRIILYFS